MQRSYRARISSISSTDDSSPFGCGFQSASARRIAAQRQHVLDAGRRDLVEDLAQAVDESPTGQVRHRLHTQVLLDPFRHLDRALARGAGGPVGDRDVVGVVLLQLAQRSLEGPLALVGLGREELEREAWRRRGENLVDSHDGEW